MQQPKSLTHVDTHWSRALYYDFFTAQEEDKELLMAAERSSRGARPERGGSPVHTAANRLAIFIAIYTAVAFAVHFLFWPTATASAPDRTPTPESAAAPPNPSSVGGQLSPDDSIDQGSGRGEVAQICKPTTAPESMSLYD